MFSRLRDGLLSPGDCNKYYGEKFRKAGVYFLLLLLFFILPNFFKFLATPLLNNDLKKEIKAVFYAEEVPFRIEDGRLISASVDKDLIYEVPTKNILFVFTESDIIIGDTPAVIFGQNGVLLSFNRLEQRLLEYKDYDFLMNLDFTDPRLTFQNVKFWDHIFSIFTDALNKYRLKINIVNLLRLIATSSVEMILVMLVLAVIAKLRVAGALKFKGIYQISVYSMTPLAFIDAFSVLFASPFLIYVGYLLAVIYHGVTVNTVLTKKLFGKGDHSGV